WVSTATGVPSSRFFFQNMKPANLVALLEQTLTNHSRDAILAH
ncbi:MAG: hypothetical protein RIS82_747, partial [Actinomycetota bacterium]